MKLFDERFVHFMWEEELEGKEGFVANDIKTLIEAVNRNYSKHKVGHTVSCSQLGKEPEKEEPYRRSKL